MSQADPQAVQQNKMDAKNIENEDFLIELNKLGEKIIYTMHKESLQHQAKFVLVTRMPQLYKSITNKGGYALNTTTSTLSNEHYLLPDNLQHFNECAYGIIALDIAHYLQKNNLIPKQHIKIDFENRG